MEALQIDWKAIFSPEVPVLELVVRGSIAYLLVVVLMRLSLRRSAGELAMMDLAFVFLIAESLTNAMAVEDQSMVDGLVLVLTIMVWNYLLNSLSYSVPLIERLISPPPLQVVREGRLLTRNMRREFLTKQELMGHLREEGVEDLAEVKAAYVEADGTVSVITRNERE